jgi:hypothetical protein
MASAMLAARQRKKKARQGPLKAPSFPCRAVTMFSYCPETANSDIRRSNDTVSDERHEKHRSGSTGVKLCGALVCNKLATVDFQSRNQPGALIRSSAANPQARYVRSNSIRPHFPHDLHDWHGEISPGLVGNTPIFNR